MSFGGGCAETITLHAPHLYNPNVWDSTTVLYNNCTRDAPARRACSRGRRFVYVHHDARPERQDHAKQPMHRREKQAHLAESAAGSP